VRNSGDFLDCPIKRGYYLNMAVDFEDNEACFHFHAYRYQSKRFDHWELVNEGWARSRDKNPDYASIGARNAIIDYIREELRQDKRGKVAEPPLHLTGDCISGRKDDRDIIDAKDYIETLTANLSDTERHLIEDKFYKGLTYRQIADKHNTSHQVIYGRMQRLLKRLRERDE
jgi:RNA polymerase sigma factor (sigma-70 family)